MGTIPVEIEQKKFDVHDLTKAVKFYFQDFGLTGVNVAIVDGNKESPYIISINGKDVKVQHILILLDYCTKNLAKLSKDNDNIEYPAKKAISDLADATKYLLESNGLKISQGETMEG